MLSLICDATHTYRQRIVVCVVKISFQINPLDLLLLLATLKVLFDQFLKPVIVASVRRPLSSSGRRGSGRAEASEARPSWIDLLDLLFWWWGWGMGGGGGWEGGRGRPVGEAGGGPAKVR